MVLIIDDEYALHEVMSEILELSGIQVMCASTGQEGTALFREHFDILKAVFLDLHLPDISGRAILHALREMNPTINVVIMSGQPEFVTMAEFNGQEHLSYLEKPFTLDVLMATVNQVLTTASCH